MIESITSGSATLWLSIGFLVFLLLLWIIERKIHPPVSYDVTLYNPGGWVVVFKDDVKIYEGPLDDAPDKIIKAVRKITKYSKYIRKRLED